MLPIYFWVRAPPQLSFNPFKHNGTPVSKNRLLNLYKNSLRKKADDRKPMLKRVKNNAKSSKADLTERKCMYISGVPGTGKTITLNEVITNLKSLKTVPPFQFISVNALKLPSPKHIWNFIYKEMTPSANVKRISPLRAFENLQNYFIKGKLCKDFTNIPRVILVDELDMLHTRRQDIMYNLFDWPLSTKSPSCLIVVAIANTMDLPEKTMIGRTQSRLGFNRLQFHPYTFKQLQSILQSRLQTSQIFEVDTIEFVCKKVAALNGDARKALDICKRAIDVCEREGTRGGVSMQHVNSAISQLFSPFINSVISSCSVYAKVLLKTFVSKFQENQDSGSQEILFSDLFLQFSTVCRIEGLDCINAFEFRLVCHSLASNNILKIDDKCDKHWMEHKIILNILPQHITSFIKNDATFCQVI